MINKNLKIYLILFITTLVFAGGSVGFLSYKAKTSPVPNAKLYPASGLGAGGVTMDNYVMTKNLVEHRVFSRDLEAPFEPDTWRTPGYPFFAAIFYYIFSSFYPVLFFQIILLFFTSVLIFKMAEKMMDSNWAILPVLLYIILPTTLLTTSALFTENPFVFTLVAAFYFFLFSDFKNLYTKALLCGFLLAISAYIRPASFYLLFLFVPAYLIVYLRREEINRKQFIAVGLLILIFLATLAPWYLRNKKETGVYVLFRQNAAQFYSGLHNVSTLEGRDALLEMAGLPKGMVPRDTTHSEIMKKVAIQVISEHPFKYALFHFSTLIPFFTSSGANEYGRFVHDMLPDYNPAPEPSLLQALHPFSLPLLIVVLKNHGWTLVENALWAIITLFVFLSLWKSKNVRLSRIFFVIIIYFAAVTGPIAHARYRIPVEPFMLLMAFSFLNTIYSEYKEKGFNILKKY